MPLAGLALTVTLVLGADPTSSTTAPPSTLPRSSIAAVLERQNELGLDDAQVKLLEDRDLVLQKQVAELRAQLSMAGSHGKGRSGRTEEKKEGATAGPASETPPPLSPVAAARPEGSGGGGGGGRHGGGAGGHRGGEGEHARQDPAARAASIQAQMDAADTEAWLAAESVLRAAQRDPARAVAERYREALADEREKAKPTR
jgi:hypothetical protein